MHMQYIQSLKIVINLQLPAVAVERGWSVPNRHFFQKILKKEMWEWSNR